MTDYDLSNYFPLGPEEGFEEEGFTFKAWQPKSEGVPQIVIVQAFQKNLLFKEIAVPLLYPTAWGIDAEDLHSIEEATQKLLEEIK